MKNGLLKGFLVLATISQVIFIGQARAVDGPGAPPRTIGGTVDRVDNDSIYIRTDEGPVHAYSLKDKRRENARTFNQGDRVVVETGWTNRMIDIYPGTLLLSSQAQGYRTISGKVKTFSPSDERITLETSSGEQTFAVNDSTVRKMHSIREGSRVTVEIDDQNRVTNIRRG